MEINFIKKTINEILEKLQISFEVEITKDTEINTTIFLIKTNESNLLIGYKGINLTALNHIVRKIVNRRFDTKENNLYFIIDVNNYHRNKIEDIKINAKMLAQRAKYFKSSIEMDPLPSYERMIVHAIFTGSRDFKTTSYGDGNERRVVIKYIDK